MKGGSDNAPVHPRSQAGFFSVLFFTYTLDTFRKGRFWNTSNLYKPLDCHRSEILVDTFERLWILHEEEYKKTDKRPSILVVLFRLFWFDVLVDSILLILSLVPRIIQPLLLGNILTYFSSTTVTKSEAHWYIILLVISNVLSAILSVQYKFSSCITAMKIRITCSTCIHRKILRMSPSTQNNALNLISNDLSRFDKTSSYIHYVWASPLFLISILNLLYYDVGVSGFAGVLWFILYMILQSFLSRWIGSYRNIIAKRTDARIKVMTEILSSIKSIKMQAWENPFYNLVKIYRNIEMKIVRKVTYCKGILYSLQAFINVSAIFFALIAMVLSKEEIYAPKVFKLITYYYSFNYVITLMFPLSITKATELHQVLKRVNAFLIQEEMEESLKKDDGIVNKEMIHLQNVTVEWSNSDKILENGTKLNLRDEELLLKKNIQNFVLQNVNVNFEEGKLYGITGAVGNGKSTLLMAILGEAKTSGYLYLKGSISYASQEPWFFAGTIRQNILFANPMDEERYLEVIRVCGLKTDLETLPERDKTPVGECGLCLSGGQKSRINLARAIYRNADVYLLDDPLSSVDVKVANHVMEECIMGFLKDKCRILVTHNVNHLKSCDQVVLVNSGRLETHNCIEKLKNNECIYRNYSEDGNLQEVEKPIEKIISLQPKKEGKKNNKNETFQREKTKESNMFAYLTSGNNFFIIVSVLLIFIITQSTESFIFFFISYWTHKEECKNISNTTTVDLHFTVFSERYFYLFVFLGILGTLLVNSICRAVSYSTMVMRSSNALHDNMLRKVICSKLSFFEAVDIGQILSRFSKDLGAVDEVLPRTIMESSIVVLGILAKILIIGYVNPYLIIVVLAFTALFSSFIKIFVYTSKNLKRIEGELMGPVITQVRSTIEGLSTIRASNAQQLMEKEYCVNQNAYTSSCYMFSTVTHAFSFAVEFVTTIFISIVTISCFLMEEKIRLNGSQIGLAITQSMAFTTYLQFCIIQCVQANNNLVAVERIREYEDLEQESLSTTTELVEEDWPEFGSITFKNVQVQYDGDSQPVLKDLNFTIAAGEKVGIVGRTGGGKTSLIASILKLTHIQGEILIDSRNIQTLPPNTIRSRLSVIPQDPILFSGTLRFNLDPFGRIDDFVLNQSLKEVRWSSSLTLDDQIIDRGSNLSIGQKQLICLARTIVRRNRIILIDEATSNMDIGTDKMMQEVIRKQFKECTVLTIAHRISTVLDYDKIMVIERGRLLEFDSPESLLKNDKSKLYEMMKETIK